MEIELSEKDFFEWCQAEDIELSNGFKPGNVDYISVRSYENESHAYGIRNNLQVITYWDSDPPLREQQIESLLKMASASLISK